MMIRYTPNNFINQWLAQFRIVKESVCVLMYLCSYKSEGKLLHGQILQ